MSEHLDPTTSNSEPSNASGRIAIVDLADELQVWKQTIFKIAKRLDIQSSRRRESERGNQLVATVTQAEADLIKSEVLGKRRANAGAIPAGSDYNADEGVFYLIQLEPEHDPGRFKVGFTTDLDGRLRKHRCSAPFAVSVKAWPCRRVWERTAKDFITTELKQLHTEVFHAGSLEEVAARGDRFFEMAPPVKGAQDLMEDDDGLIAEDAG